MTSDASTHSLLLVPSASHATKGEATLIRAGVPCRLIPVPRTVSSQCGVCLRVLFSDRERAVKLAGAAGLQISGIHDLRITSTSEEATDDGSTGSQREAD